MRLAAYPHLKQLDGTINPTLAADLATGAIAVGDAVQTLSYWDNPGCRRGGVTYLVVPAATGVNDGGAHIDLPSGPQLQAQFPAAHIPLSAYGANPLTGADAAPIIKAALTWLLSDPDSSRRPILIDGRYETATPLAVANWAGNIQLIGYGHQDNNWGSALTYTGVGAGTAFDLRGTRRDRLTGVAFLYRSTGFTGTLVDLTGASLDNSNTVIDQCYLGAEQPTARSAAALLKVDRAHSLKVRDTQFHGANWLIEGPTPPGYANRVTIDGCTFGEYTSGVIHNPGVAWTVTNGTFEAADDGLVRAVVVDPGRTARAFTLNGSWIGDISNATTTEGVVKYRGSGFRAAGNSVELYAGPFFQAMEEVHGVDITGNYFAGNQNACVADFTQPGAVASTGVTVTSNTHPVLFIAGYDRRLGVWRGNTPPLGAVWQDPINGRLLQQGGSGVTTGRPVVPPSVAGYLGGSAGYGGYPYWDITLNKPVWLQPPSTWRDATGMSL